MASDRIIVGTSVYQVSLIRSITDNGYCLLVIFDPDQAPAYQVFTDAAAEAFRVQAAQYPRLAPQLLLAPPQTSFQNRVELIGQLRQAPEHHYDCHGADVYTALLSSQQAPHDPESLYAPKQEEWHYVSAKAELGHRLTTIPIGTPLHIRGRLVGYARYDEQRIPHLTTEIAADTITVLPR